jgi:hypothetical protein
MKQDDLLDAFAELQFNLKEAGISDDGVARMTRFIKLDFNSEIGQSELKRWKEVGLIKNGKIVITESDVKELNIITFCLWEAVYKGDLQFLPPDKYSITEKKKLEIETELEFAEKSEPLRAGDK